MEHLVLVAQRVLLDIRLELRRIRILLDEDDGAEDEEQEDL